MLEIYEIEGSYSMKKKKGCFDGDTCIRLLLDKSLDPGLRGDAADSLMHYAKPQACRAMLGVIHDESEDFDLREEVAEYLGSLWAEMEYNQKDFDAIPEPFKAALVREFEMCRNSCQN